MNHDRLFKELIGNFFFEFVDLFLPNVSAYLDRSFEMQRMDKELFTDVTIGDSRLVNLVFKVKFRNRDAFFLIHVESQARSEPDFPTRMFRYFGKLTEIYNLPVYPVVIYSHKRPTRPEPDQYRVAFDDWEVLRFQYAVIQLNRLSWREFVNRPNPVASALMARMQMTPQERPTVKLECLRLLATLKLDPARSKLIGGFIDSYLKLTAQETQHYERELSALEPTEKDATMALVSSWEKQGIAQGRTEGRAEGRAEGKEELLFRLMRRRLFRDSVPPAVRKRLGRLTAEQMDELGEALLDFAGPGDLEQWLATRVV